jgi:hypothetical protein
MLESNRAVIQTVQEWEPVYHIFGPTSFLGMAVSHNLQVKAHLDSKDNRQGFVVMTDWGHFTGQSRKNPCFDSH